jgi:hypothetical protein
MTTRDARGEAIMRTIAGLLLVTALLVPAAVVGAQEPPPYSGGGAAQGNDQGTQSADTAQDPAAASADYFHQELSPYGQWVDRGGYGMVWMPSVAAGWRPYTTGHWANTDQGWAWVADEDWGWAPFHYGRWYYDADYNAWGWVPGTVWAPSWVSWREGEGYLGWAPLPPAVGFSDGVVEIGAVEIAPRFYTVVGERDFLAPHVGAVLLRGTASDGIVPRTENITHYGLSNGRILSGGVSTQRIAQVTGHPVPRTTVASLSGSGGRKGAFYQPAVVTRAAKASRAEFGRALHTQVAAVRRSSSFQRVAADTRRSNQNRQVGTPRSTRGPGSATGTSRTGTGGARGGQANGPKPATPGGTTAKPAAKPAPAPAKPKDKKPPL